MYYLFKIKGLVLSKEQDPNLYQKKIKIDHSTSDENNLRDNGGPNPVKVFVNIAVDSRNAFHTARHGSKTDDSDD